MNGWESEAIRWFGIAEQQVAALLGMIGQNNEFMVLGTVVLIGLLTLTLLWTLLLALLRGFVGLFGEPEPAGPDLRQGGFGFSPATVRAEPGRLDIVPSTRDREPPLKSRAAEEPKVSVPARPRPATRLSEAAGGSPGALPISPADDLKQVQLRALPKLADRGRVISARPEWTGKVVPSSLQEAGAVEVCRVLSRRPTALAGGESVRAVDYRVCGLPRVDGEGRRQPDVLVYTVADRGFLPKSGPNKPGRK